VIATQTLIPADAALPAHSLSGLVEILGMESDWSLSRDDFPLHGAYFNRLDFARAALSPKYAHACG
jgi:hypothetical protein